MSFYILEAAAYTHDIGIRVAEEKYGKCDGKLQVQEGPIVAQKILSELGFENYMIERICYLIGHHHTYSNIDGMDYQILIEADFLVNLYEDKSNIFAIKSAYKKNIKPKPEKVGTTPKGETVWRCIICGYEYVGEELPEDFICPWCKHPASDFEKIIR